MGQFDYGGTQGVKGVGDQLLPGSLILVHPGIRVTTVLMQHRYNTVYMCI
jgi:hypothetical protein